MKIGFLVWNSFQYLHFKEMMSHFPEAELLIWKKNEQTSENFNSINFSILNIPVRFFAANEVKNLDGQYDVILSQNRLPKSHQFRKTKFVMVQYSLAKDLTAFNIRWSQVDFGLVYGNHSKNLLDGICNVGAVGNPRFDPYFRNEFDPHFQNQLKLNLDPNKKTILYLPTWGDLSSFARFNTAIRDLENNYNVISKTHHLTGADVEINGTPCKLSKQNVLVDESLNLYPVADIVMSDYSGAIFDALYLSKPVVLLRDKKIESNDHLKLSTQSLEISASDQIGPVVYLPAELRGVICSIFDKGNSFREVNQKLVAECFSYKGEAGIAAKKVITEFLSNNQKRLSSPEAGSSLTTKKATKTTLKKIAKRGLHKANAKFGAKPQKILNRILVFGFNRIDKYLSERVRYKVYRCTYPLLKQQSSFIDRHISLMVKVQEVDEIEKYYSHVELDQIDTNLLLRGLQKGGCNVTLGIQLEKWKDLEPSKQISSLHSFENAAGFLGHPYRLVLPIRKRVIDLAIKGENPKTDIRCLIRAGFLTYAQEQMTKLSFDSGNFQEYLNGIKSNLGSNLLSLFETGSQNHLLPLSERLALLEGKTILASDYAGPQRVIELFLPSSFLIRVRTGEVDQVREKLILFYNNIFAWAQMNQVPILPVIQYGWFAPWANPKYLSISHHTMAGHNSHFHLKYSSLAGYISFDSEGFAGWASLANPENNFVSQINRIDKDKAEAQWNNLYTNFVKANVSKYSQKEIQDHAAPVDGKYIFVPLQIVDDMVAKLAFIDCITLMKLLINRFENSDFKLAIKRHPLCQNIEVQAELSRASKLPHVVISDASIHSLLEHATAVITVNSGVGLEALMHLKKVIVAGQADYSPACTLVRSTSELDSFISQDNWFIPDAEFIKKFLYFYTSHYLIKADDFNALDKRLLELIA